jgi:N,N'-diacetyllegionaminate synthase
VDKVFQLGSRQIGDDQPVFITAELGLNHNGDSELAREMIRMAAQSGVDAVKFQVFKAESFISGDIAKAKHQKESLDSGESVFDMWKRLELPENKLLELSDYAKSLGMIFYASAFDAQSVDMLNKLSVPLFKVASGEITNLPLLRRMAEKGQPILMSVGMASLGEIESAITAIRESGNTKVALLHCVANYPARFEDVHLKRIRKLRQIFNVPVGYSDHTTSPWACIASVGIGASFIEKHFTLNKNQPGTDHVLSADLAELKIIVDGVRTVELALGNDQWEPLETEQEGRVLFRRGIVATTSISKGMIITEDMLTTKRPAHGIQPSLFEIVVGRIARRDIFSGAAVTWDDV